MTSVVPVVVERAHASSGVLGGTIVRLTWFLHLLDRVHDRNQLEAVGRVCTALQTAVALKFRHDADQKNDARPAV